MTIRQFRGLLPFWQQVLNLKEWKITVRFGSDEEMSSPGHPCQGLNYFSVEELSSEILLHPETDESTLVHELLHLVFDGHKHKLGKYDPLHERALNRTAAALMELAELIRQ
jgi:hypothetical protein